MPDEVRVTEDPRQIPMAVEEVLTKGKGLTVIVKVLSGPVQLFKDALTVIILVIGLEVELIAVKERGFVCPFVLRPIAVFELVHEKDAPGRLLVNVEAVTVVPAHSVIFTGVFTTGNWLTEIETTVVLIQPSALVPVIE